ncbi:MAG: PilZ domain-containing protein [Proteobacteria bacterium]|nr:PilZ domain-containing protein [Pseudomonadota bacterium]MBU1640951.1 PilZ domain-containing protein [Pseudomonadota bacterium]
MANTPENQRKHARTDSLNLSFFCIDKDDNVMAQGMGRTLNLSETGILLETSVQMTPGQSVDMEIALQNDIIDARGTVAHSKAIDDDHFHTGIEFNHLSHADMEILKTHL